MKRAGFLIFTVFNILSNAALAAISTIQKIEDTSPLEKQVVMNFQHYCLNNINDWQQIKKLASNAGLKEEENPYSKTKPPFLPEQRWIINENANTITRLNLILQGNQCTVSAMTHHEGHIRLSDTQTPIESYLINVLDAQLITVNREEQGEFRIFDVVFHKQPATIFLQIKILPSEQKTGTYFYQILMSLVPQ